MFAALRGREPCVLRKSGRPTAPAEFWSTGRRTAGVNPPRASGTEKAVSSIVGTAQESARAEQRREVWSPGRMLLGHIRACKLPPFPCVGLPPPSNRLCCWPPSHLLANDQRRSTARSVSHSLETPCRLSCPCLSSFSPETHGAFSCSHSSPCSGPALPSRSWPCDDHPPASTLPPCLRYRLGHPFSLPRGSLAHPAINLQMGHFLLQREADFFFSELCSF